MKGKKTGGRKPGSVNKTTASVKEALEQAFEGAGGIDSLIKFAKSRPAYFYPLWVKMLPTEVKATVAQIVKPVITKVVVEHHVVADHPAPSQPAISEGGERGTEVGLPSGADEGMGLNGSIHPRFGGDS